MESKSKSPLRAVGYTRRSQHREGFGLNAQADAINRWAEYEQAEVVEIVEDDATSGVSDPSSREGLTRALETLRAGDADALVVAKFDRLARSLVSFADVLKLSEAEGWTIICLDPQLDLRTAVGRAMASMLIAFGDVEREAFRDRMQGGRRAKIARGGFAGGQRLHPKFGFKLVRQEDGRSEYVPEPEQQRVIGRIQELRAAGQKLADVAATLEAEGIPTPAGGQSWRVMTISQLARTAVVA